MIPIYRAKKIGLNNSYIIGFYQQYIEGFQDNIFHEINNTLIDPTTLAIHFSDMLDSQGNKIFASLSEDGKGGDKFLFDNETFIIWFDNQSLKINATNKDNFECNCHDSLNEWYDFSNKCYDLKVIGIQQ